MILALIFATIALAFLSGCVIGATVIRDALDGLWFWPWRDRKPKPAKPQKPTIPLARALYNAQWDRRLEIPTIKRQREVRTALGWERQ